jgi:hypothetical protein
MPSIDAASAPRASFREKCLSDEDDACFLPLLIFMNYVSLLADIARFKMNLVQNQYAISRFCKSFQRAAIMKITKSPHEISHIEKMNFQFFQINIVDDRFITKYLRK